MVQIGRYATCETPKRLWQSFRTVAVEDFNILTGSKDGTVRLWTVPEPIPGDPERVILWSQALTGMQLDQSGMVRHLDAKEWQSCIERSGFVGVPR
jgi:hypothetical protein